MEARRESMFDRVTRTLADHVSPDETVRVVIRGTRGQAIVGTDTGVLVLPPIVPGAAPGPVPSWPYLDVLGIELDEPAIGATVALHVPEGQAVIVARGDWDAIRARVAILRGLVARVHSAAVPPELRLVAL